MSSLIAALTGAMLAAATVTNPTIVAPRLPPGNPFNARMLALRPIDQAGALRRSITGNDMKCGRLLKGVYQGPYKNLGMWSARCKPGGDYGVFTGPDGTVQVRNCGDLVALKLPACKLD